MQSLAARIILSIIIGLVAWGLTFLLGLVISLVPIISPIGDFVKFVSVGVGVLAGVYYFITQKNPLR